MSNNFQVLSESLIELSRGTSWDQAVLEWHPTYIWQEEDGTCTCGYHPITNHCEIHNPHTNQTLVVGSRCIKRFFDMPEVTAVFEGLDRLRRDQEIATPKAVFRYANSVKWISTGDFWFAQKTHGKRNLTDEQMKYRRFLNRRILAKSLQKQLARL